MRTTARRVDGGWRLDGRKVWTSYAQFADWGVCLARSDPAAPKHKGLSFFVVDMHAPGVEVRPLVQLTGEAEFNEVELDDVFVPDDQLVGAPGEGWRVAGSTLSHERGVNPRQLVIHLQHLEELLRTAAAARRLRRHPAAPQAGPGLRRGPAVPAAQLALALQAAARARARARGEHPQALLERDEQAPPRRSPSRSCGPAAPLWRDATDNPGDGSWQRAWLYYQAASIFAGHQRDPAQRDRRACARPAP